MAFKIVFSFPLFSSYVRRDDEVILSFLEEGRILDLRKGRAIVIAATIPDNIHPMIKGKTFTVDQLKIRKYVRLKDKRTL